ncbi:MAG: hypothetical protein K5898_15105 [Ruminococcus sp.]|uniref:hypothetical protein n=1 Tax=Ruminococcus sp. TaxID=41978 RepID=UPI0025D673C3|nr:hypothetical protein [Ruminococcus sp.]MCR4796467.1 hypothetical protein [Ruminococcus sp.]
MKKTVSCLMILAMIFSGVSCGGSGSEKSEVQATTKQTAPPKYPEATESFPVEINADSFIGEWSSGKNRIIIEKSGDGYIADIEWRIGPGEFLKDYKLNYKCVYNETDLTMACSDGVLFETEYFDDGTTAEKQVYDDGTAIFRISVETREWQGKELHEYTLLWFDDKDDSFRDWEFVKTNL